MTNDTESTVRETPLIVVFPRGQLSADDKERMTLMGVLAVEADSPKDVHQLHLSQPFVCTSINGDAIVRAALAALTSQSPQTSGGSINNLGLANVEFVRLLSASLKDQA